MSNSMGYNLFALLLIVVGIFFIIMGITMGAKDGFGQRGTKEYIGLMFCVPGVLLIIVACLIQIPPAIETETYQIVGDVDYDSGNQTLYFIEQNNENDKNNKGKQFSTSSDIEVDYATTTDGTSYVTITTETRAAIGGNPIVTKLIVGTPASGI